MNLTLLHNLFDNYIYDFRRPNYLPNKYHVADNPLFCAWLAGYLFNVPSLEENAKTWDMYKILKDSSAEVIHEGKSSEIPEDLKTGDVIFFSVNPQFDVIAPLNYWCGIYWDKDHFVNFNGIEGFADRSLKGYLKDKSFNYAYCSVIRISTYAIASSDFVPPSVNP